MSSEQDFLRTLEAKFYPSPEEMAKRLELHSAKEEILLYLAKAGTSAEVLYHWPEARRGTLTDVGILQHLVAGNIEIHPFDYRLLQNNGYDVRLGPHHYTHINPEKGGPTSVIYSPGAPGIPFYNPLSPKNVVETWSGPLLPIRADDLPREFGANLEFTEASEAMFFLQGLQENDMVIIVLPGGTILGHTIEFIGGRNIILTRISGRSTVGRSMIEVCSDANLGALGYIGRWALEVTNKSHESAVILLVEEPLATIQFELVGPALINYAGSYGQGDNLEEMVANWTPEKLLPRWKRFTK